MDNTVKQLILDWRSVEDQIKEIEQQILPFKQQISPLANENKNLMKQIMKHMRETEEDEYETSFGIVKYVKKNTPKALTKKMIFTRLLMLYSTDTAKAKEILEFIMEGRPVTKQEKLVLEHTA